MYLASLLWPLDESAIRCIMVAVIVPLSGDRRQAPRIVVALPVELESGKGVTRDVSISGAFFETDQSLSPGASIGLSMLLEHVDPRGPLRLRCEGLVVRVEPRKSKVRVAVAFEEYRLEPTGQPALATGPGGRGLPV